MSPTPNKGPGSYSQVSEERQAATPVSTEGFATEAIAEAKKTTVHVSLLLIVALTAGAFWAGRSSPPPELVAQIAAQNERASANAATTAEQLKRTTELLEKVVQAQAAQTELARTTNTEVQFISSYYKTGRAP